MVFYLLKGRRVDTFYLHKRYQHMKKKYRNNVGYYFYKYYPIHQLLGIRVHHVKVL